MPAFLDYTVCHLPTSSWIIINIFFFTNFIAIFSFLFNPYTSPTVRRLNFHCVLSLLFTGCLPDPLFAEPFPPPPHSHTNTIYPPYSNFHCILSLLFTGCLPDPLFVEPLPPPPTHSYKHYIKTPWIFPSTFTSFFLFILIILGEAYFNWTLSFIKWDL